MGKKNGFWSVIKERWSTSGYRRDYFYGKEGESGHVHDYYEVGENNESGRVRKNDDGTHEPMGIDD